MYIIVIHLGPTNFAAHFGSVLFGSVSAVGSVRQAPKATSARRCSRPLASLSWLFSRPFSRLFRRPLSQMFGQMSSQLFSPMICEMYSACCSASQGFLPPKRSSATEKMVYLLSLFYLASGESLEQRPRPLAIRSQTEGICNSRVACVDGSYAVATILARGAGAR